MKEKREITIQNSCSEKNYIFFFLVELMMAGLIIRQNFVPISCFFGSQIFIWNENEHI